MAADLISVSDPAVAKVKFIWSAATVVAVVPASIPTAAIAFSIERRVNLFIIKLYQLLHMNYQFRSASKQLTYLEEY
jgi:hypothetical protein